MRTSIIAVLISSISISASGAGNGQPGDNVWEQLEALQAQVAALQAANPPAHLSLTVDCAIGETLGDALATPAKELDITFSGVCVEDVAIERGVSITGAAGAEIQGAVTVNSQGADVNLDAVSIVNASGIGLSVSRSSHVVARALHVQGATVAGIQIAGGSFICADCSANGNGGDGLQVAFAGNAMLAGHSVFNQNGGAGAQAIGSASLTLALDPQSYGAAANSNELEVNGNGFYGVVLSNGSSLQVNAGDQLTAHNNGPGIGVIIGTGCSANLFGQVSVEGNGVGFGAFGGHVFTSSTTTINAANNVVGIMSSQGAVVRGSATVFSTNNVRGMYAIGGQWFVPDLNITGNTGFAALVFQGSIVTAGAGTVSGFVLCDGTEVLTGFACGANP